MARPSPERVTKVIPYKNSWNNGGSPRSSSGSTTVTTYDRSYSGTVTPGFPDVRPLPINDYSMSLRRYFPGSYHYEARHVTNPRIWSVWDGCSQGYAIPMPTLFASSEVFSNAADSQARSRCISAIQRLHTNVAQNVGEYKQVNGMFLSTARRFAAAYSALRRGDVSGFTRNVSIRRRDQQNLLNYGPMSIRKWAPNLWLEYSYGWSPLCSDMYDVITSFYKRVEEGYTMVAEGSRNIVTVDYSAYGQNDGTTTYQTVYKRRYVRYKVWYEIDNARLANMSSWGLTNPALLAWELLPYSFVVDWFLPVGDWLSQVGYSVGLYFKKGVKSGVAENTYARIYGPRPPTSTYVYRSRGNDVYQDTRFQRVKLTTFPAAPRPRFDKDGLRGKRIANALALLAQAFNR